jgi:formiminotetrahydrofolate cyclodeaminase
LDERVTSRAEPIFNPIQKRFQVLAWRCPNQDKKRRNNLSNAASSLWILTAAQLRDRVASIDPTPGGGSVSIIAATLAVASICKGVVVSLKKSAADSARHQSLLDINSKASVLIASLSKLADADSAAFQGYLQACALPRTTESEKAARKAVREVSLVRATQIPLEAAAEMGRGLKCADAAAGLVDAHVRSEVLAGGVLLRASIRSVLLSVDANLSGISDAVLRDSLSSRRKELECASVPNEVVAK